MQSPYGGMPPFKEAGPGYAGPTIQSNMVGMMSRPAGLQQVGDSPTGISSEAIMSMLGQAIAPSVTEPAPEVGASARAELLARMQEAAAEREAAMRAAEAEETQAADVRAKKPRHANTRELLGIALLAALAGDQGGEVLRGAASGYSRGIEGQKADAKEEAALKREGHLRKAAQAERRGVATGQQVDDWLKMYQLDVTEEGRKLDREDRRLRQQQAAEVAADKAIQSASNALSIRQSELRASKEPGEEAALRDSLLRAYRDYSAALRKGGYGDMATALDQGGAQALVDEQIAGWKSDLVAAEEAEAEKKIAERLYSIPKLEWTHRRERLKEVDALLEQYPALRRTFQGDYSVIAKQTPTEAAEEARAMYLADPLHRELLQLEKVKSGAQIALLVARRRKLLTGGSGGSGGDALPKDLDSLNKMSTLLAREVTSVIKQINDGAYADEKEYNELNYKLKMLQAGQSAVQERVLQVTPGKAPPPGTPAPGQGNPLAPPPTTRGNLKL